MVFAAATRNLGRRLATVRTHRAEKKSIAYAVKSNVGPDVIVSGTPGDIEEKRPCICPSKPTLTLSAWEPPSTCAVSWASGPIATLFVALMLMFLAGAAFIEEPKEAGTV